MTTYMVAEKNGSRILHIYESANGRKRTKTLEVACDKFSHVAFLSEPEALAAIQELKVNLPHFTFELVTPDQFAVLDPRFPHSMFRIR